jgi:hypothetical protein
MGLDIYLKSIHEPFVNSQAFEDMLKQLKGQAAYTDPRMLVQARFELLKKSGGYFRDAYNTGSLLWALGLSCRNDLFPMLDETRHLPIDKAIELVAMIDARPLTKESFGRHYLANIANEGEPSPEAPLGVIIQAMMDRQHPAPDGCDSQMM